MSFPQVVLILWKKCVNCVILSEYTVNVSGCCDLGPQCITNPLKCQVPPDTLRTGTFPLDSIKFSTGSQCKTVRTQCPTTVIQIDSEFACGKLLENCGKLVEKV